MSQPKYLQVIDYLTELCKEKSAHDPIPSERDIAISLDMSRMTVRKAVEELCRQNVLYRDGNKGTFVSPKKTAVQPKSAAAQPAVQARKQRILYMDTVYSPVNVRHVQKALELGDEDTLFRLIRLNLCESVPLSVEEIYSSSENVNDEDLGSLGAMLDLNQYRKNGLCQTRLVPVLLPGKYSRLLEVKMDSPVIRQDEEIRTKEGKPFLYVQTYFNPETSPFNSFG